MNQSTSPRDAFHRLASRILEAAGHNAPLEEVEPESTARIGLRVEGVPCAIFHRPERPDLLLSHYTVAGGALSAQHMQRLLEATRMTARLTAGSFAINPESGEALFSTVTPLETTTAESAMEEMRSVASYLRPMNAELEARP